MSRMGTVLRILVGIPLIIVMYVASIFVGAVLLVYAALDILYGLVVGGDLGGTASIVRLIQWNADNTSYLVTGKGGPRWTP